MFYLIEKNISLYQYFKCNVIFQYNPYNPFLATLCILFIWMTSILYWYHPINNWRRHLDICVTHLSIGIYLLCLFLYKPLYWLETIIAVIVSGVLLRYATLYYGNKYWTTCRSNPEFKDDGNNKDNPFLWISSIFHSLLHITINAIGLFSIHNYHLLLMPQMHVVVIDTTDSYQNIFF